MKYVLIYDHDAMEGERVRLRNRYGMTKWHPMFGVNSHDLDTPLREHVRVDKFRREDTDSTFSILAQVGRLHVKLWRYVW